MQSLFSLAERCSASLLRLSLGVILGWIGALKFVDPTPVVGLLQASFSFLAFPQFVYGLGAAEVAAAVRADKLIFLTDVDGLFRDFADKSSLISATTLEQCQAMVDAGVGTMITLD